MKFDRQQWAVVNIVLLMRNIGSMCSWQVQTGEGRCFGFVRGSADFPPQRSWLRHLLPTCRWISIHSANVPVVVSNIHYPRWEEEQWYPWPIAAAPQCPHEEAQNSLEQSRLFPTPATRPHFPPLRPIPLREAYYLPPQTRCYSPKCRLRRLHGP